MKKRKSLYPGTEEAERRRGTKYTVPTEDGHDPDWIHGCPNYKKFEEKGYSIEEILVLFNID